jgi:hypothetical protein
MDRLRRSFKFELVPYQPPEKALMPRDQYGVKIPIRRRGGVGKNE